MAKQSLNVKDLSGNKEMQTVVTLFGSVSHEFKNYLAAINICAAISENSLKNIKEAVKDANDLISSLLLQIKYTIAGKPNTEDFECYSMLKNIKEALKKYPFKSEEERRLVILENSEDFTYTGNSMLTNHIIYNLVKNALLAIKNANKGSITIRLKPGKFNELIFRDTASGIPKEFLSKMFEPFESKTISQGGTGLGLAFCKTIMTSYGGDISCSSVEHDHTEFTLRFPRVSSEIKSNVT